MRVINRGVVEYATAWREQQEMFEELLHAKGSASHTEGVLMLCEHPHVYTLGRSGNISNMLIDEQFLASINATYFKTDRGGDITYHGYGQLVGYPILDLEYYGLSLKQYIHLLEESIIATIARWGIVGSRMEGATGVWIEGRRKICAIGVKASRYVTMHGFALNVNTDLKYFSYINPCGFTDKAVTSISAECKEEKVDMERVKEVFVEEFFRLFMPLQEQ